MRPPLLREAANLCRRLVCVHWMSESLLTRTLVGKQYRPGPPGINFSRSLDLLDLEELQQSGSLGESEGATIDETAVYAEASLRDGLCLCLDYMETVSQNILYHVEQASTFVRDDHDPENWELLFREAEALKLALREKIHMRLAIRVHMHFLRFCTWLKGQEETGSAEERLLWERSFLQVHTSVRGEVEEALRAVVDVENTRFIHI